MIHLKTYEGFSLVPKYFSKESKERRNNKETIKRNLRTLLNEKLLNINTSVKYYDIYKRAKRSDNLDGFFINDDLTIDIVGDIEINLEDAHFAYTDILKTLRFNTIVGDFKMKDRFYGRIRKLTNYDFLPHTISGDIDLTGNYIESFSQLPVKEVKGTLILNDNNISSLDNMPNANYIQLIANKIYSLDNLESGDKRINKLSLRSNPIENIRFIRGQFHVPLLEFLFNDSDAFDLFKEYDPIHPPVNKGDKPILYLDRLQSFMDSYDLDLDNKKTKYSVQTLRNFSEYYDVQNS